MEEDSIETARSHVDRILLANGGELGLLGSNQAYQQVWARDSMICGLMLWLTRDTAGRAIHARSLESLLWLLYQDSHEFGLLEVNEAMDWADLFVNRYNVLYDNVLYFAVSQ